jgi:hypothetical protein
MRVRYTLHMRILQLIAIAAIAATSPAWASSPRMDGQLPMYPNAKINSQIANMPSNAIAHGVPLVLKSPDSVHTVDLWYKSNTSSACKRTEQSKGVQYKCPGGSIMIYTHGGTEIALVPPL